MLEIPAVYNLFTLAFFVFGSLLGSFSNVVIFRMASGASVIFPPSACPKCNHRLSATDLFPVISWLFLMGRCRYCKAPISCQYPLVEAAISLIVGFSFYRYGLTLGFIAMASALTIWFIGSVIFLRNEVNKPNPFIWALVYYVLLVFTQSPVLAINETLMFFVIASFCGLLACRGRSSAVFAGWFALSFMSMWAMKNMSFYIPGSVFLILAAAFGKEKLSKTSRVLFFTAQVLIIGYKAIV